MMKSARKENRYELFSMLNFVLIVLGVIIVRIKKKEKENGLKEECA